LNTGTGNDWFANIVEKRGVVIFYLFTPAFLLECVKKFKKYVPVRVTH
jgi:hypothetical protein